MSTPLFNGLNVCSEYGTIVRSRPATVNQNPVIPHPTPAKPERLVPAVERAARVMDTLASSRQAMTLAEISKRLKLPRSSVHGLLATLVALELARRHDDASFTVGPKALQWAGA